MQIVHLDIAQKTEAEPIYLKEGDVGRCFQVVLTKEGTPYAIPTGIVISGWYSGTAGCGNYTDLQGKQAFTVVGNTVTVEIVAAMTAAPGSGLFCLILNDSDGGQLGLWNIPYYIEHIPGADSQGATTFYSAFSEAAAKFMLDTTLTKPGQGADAYAAGRAIAGASANLKVLDAGSISSMDELSALLVDTAVGMANPGFKLLGIHCDYGSGGAGMMAVFRGESTDSIHEVFAIVVDSYCNILMGASYDDGYGSSWSNVDWTTLYEK